VTVYYQFGSRRGLFEALFDELARHGLVERLRAAFGRADPLDRLDALVAAFGSFWASDRLVIRRLRRSKEISTDELWGHLVAKHGGKALIGGNSTPRLLALEGKPPPPSSFWSFLLWSWLKHGTTTRTMPR
jgi:AcrR family transcriptional regulator